MHGGVAYELLKEENCEALSQGLENLDQHIHILSHYKIPVIVALNKFSSDTLAEIKMVQDFCERKGIQFALNESWEKGSKGAIDLSQKVMLALKQNRFAIKLFTSEQTISERIDMIAKNIYGASQVEYSEQAKAELEELKNLGYGLSNVCMAKTQSSISDDPKLLGKPRGFTLKIQSLLLSSGAKFVVALAGDIMTMPGLSKDPAANHIDIDENGRISGLF
jgi:formate--tetrahydrofolate ligase